MLSVLDIVAGTSVDGPGLRTAVYFAGCDHACPGCHNPSSHDKGAGEPMEIDDIVSIIVAHGFNVTFSGGDPLQQNADELAELARHLTDRGLSIWCYTGYTYEQVVNHPLMPYLEVLVDGPYVAALKDVSLLFRGSSNQRLIDVRLSSPHDVVLWQSSF